MGSNACNGLCQKSPALESYDDQFQPTKTLIPCQVCNVHLDEMKFKEHIDHQHYCCINQNQEGILHAKCLLCDHLSNNLEEQAKHITQKHSYVKPSQKPVDQQLAKVPTGSTIEIEYMQLFKDKKRRVKKLKSQKEFQVLLVQQGTILEASIEGQKYEGQTKTKEYRGAQFDQLVVEGDLVWFRVFSSSKDYQYYYVDIQPKQRTILCKAYLFSHKQAHQSPKQK